MFGAAISGNAAPCMEAFIYSKGSFAYRGYPDIDELLHQQARERVQAERETAMRRIQQLTIERVMFALPLVYSVLYQYKSPGTSLCPRYVPLRDCEIQFIHIDSCNRLNIVFYS